MNIEFLTFVMKQLIKFVYLYLFSFKVFALTFVVFSILFLFLIIFSFI